MVASDVVVVLYFVVAAVAVRAQRAFCSSVGVHHYHCRFLSATKPNQSYIVRGVNKEGIMIIYRDLGGRRVLVHEEGRRVMIIRAKEMVCVHYWSPLNSI